MPQTFSLTDSPPSMNYMEVKVDRADGPIMAAAPTLDWVTLKQSDDYLIGNRKYLIIVNARVGGENSIFANGFKTTQDHDGSIITPVMVIEPSSSTVPHSYCAAEIITPSVNTKINFQGQATQAIACRAKLFYLRISILDITDLREGIDYFHSVDSTAAEHGTAYVSRNTYTIDDDSTGVPSEQIVSLGDGYAQAAGNWLILATALIDVDGEYLQYSHGMKVLASTGADKRGAIEYSLAAKQTMNEEGEDDDERILLFCAFPFSASSPQLGAFGARFQIETCDPASGSGGGSNSPNSYVSSTLIGLNMSRFKDAKYEWDGDVITSTTDTEITIKTWSDQPSNDGKAFFIGCGVCDINTTDANYWTGLDQDDVDVFDLGTGLSGGLGANAGRSRDITDRPFFVAMGILDLDSSSTHEYKWQFTKDTTNSASYQDLGYAMFSLTYNYEDFYDEKVEAVKIGEVRRRRSSPTIPTIG
jgi:hypothetical protein